MRKKPGFKEIAIYLTEKEYEQLEQYWRFHTKDKHITATAAELIKEALKRTIEKPRD